jgi:hypothetical protein
MRDPLTSFLSKRAFVSGGGACGSSVGVVH